MTKQKRTHTICTTRWVQPTQWDAIPKCIDGWGGGTPCAVCVGALVSVHVTPCGHTNVCESCFDQLLGAGCMVCQRPIDVAMVRSEQSRSDRVQPWLDKHYRVAWWTIVAMQFVMWLLTVGVCGQRGLSSPLNYVATMRLFSTMFYCIEYATRDGDYKCVHAILVALSVVHLLEKLALRRFAPRYSMRTAVRFIVDGRNLSRITTLFVYEVMGLAVGAALVPVIYAAEFVISCVIFGGSWSLLLITGLATPLVVYHIELEMLRRDRALL